MTLDAQSALALFFPAATFAGGAYMVWRGIVKKDASESRRPPENIMLSGAARCSAPVTSYISGQKCIEATTTVQAYRPFTNTWGPPFMLIQRAAPFSIGGTHIDPGEASFRRRVRAELKGYPPEVERDALGAFWQNTRRANAVAILMGVIEWLGLRSHYPRISPEDRISESTVRAILGGLPPREDAGALRRMMNDGILITEAIVPVGAEVHVLSSGVTVRKGNRISGRMLVVDGAAEGVRMELREQSFFGVIAGAAVAFLSLVAAAYLISG